MLIVSRMWQEMQLCGQLWPPHKEPDVSQAGLGVPGKDFKQGNDRVRSMFVDSLCLFKCV